MKLTEISDFYDSIPKTTNEKLPEVIVRACQGLIQPELKLGDTENVCRLGNESNAGPKPRTIQVKFVFATKVMLLYQSRMKLAHSNSNVFVSKLLTKPAACLFYLARSNRRPGKALAKTWTWRGQIYVSKARNVKGTLVRSVEEANTCTTIRYTSSCPNGSSLRSFAIEYSHVV